ncbi:hypothetical protein GJAV_G00220700 [Gymnothorax javanicus]|nr:hypothetical protein GJAV_G00220700 [Gymnothorax javanicus]
MRPAGPSEGGVAYPSVFVVDGQAGYPLPANPFPRRGGRAQWPLYVLLTLALCGLAVEACFIYHLYSSTKSPDVPLNEVGRTEKLVQEKDDIKPVRRRDPMLTPSKPMAHLTAGPDRPRPDGIVLWNEKGASILHEMAYREGGLEVQKEGYYFIYSKVFFTEPECQSQTFIHQVLRKTPRYLGGNLPLMESRRVHCRSSNEQASKEQLNSYLGGLFYLVKGDIILVMAEDHKLIAYQSSYLNFFGAYMI